MKKLDITKIETDGVEQSAVTHVSWHRYNDDNSDNNAEGTWDFPGVLTAEEVLTKVQGTPAVMDGDNVVTVAEPAMVDPDIVVALNLQ